MTGDTLSVEGDTQKGEAIIRQVMRGGKRALVAPTIEQIREQAARDLARLPEPLRKLETFDYPVTIADKLKALAVDADRAMKP